MAEKKEIVPEDLADIPLLLPQCAQVKNELSNWFGESYERLNVAATYNLIINAAAMVRSKVGVVLCFDLGAIYEDLCFIPLTPALETGAVLVWKKSQMLAAATSRFIQHMKNTV